MDTSTKCIFEDVTELYLVDGEHLAIALLHLLELPQEVPAQKQAGPVVRNTHRKSNQIILAREGTALTRTWTWREPRWWPRASYGRSWGAHRRGSAERDPPPGTDGTTLEINHQNSDQPHREEQRRGGSKTRRRRRRRREAYPVGDHFRELVMPEMGGGRDPKPKRGRWRPTREERGGGGVFICWGEEP